MSSGKWRPFCLGLNMLRMVIFALLRCNKACFPLHTITILTSSAGRLNTKMSSLSHTCPWVPGFKGVREICISKAGTHGHTHQCGQSGQSMSRSWPTTQCPVARTWKSAPKQCVVMAIVEDISPSFEIVLKGLRGCFLCVG